ncbi:MAG: putative inorganic carbon transporter subunit DabA [Myxococcota bacterium]
MSSAVAVPDVGAKARVDEWLVALKPVLPLQNPLWAFVHNNILMNHEVLPFHDAVREAAALYRARGYETEVFYREQLASGRLHRAALEAVLRETLPGVSVERFLADRSLGNDVAPVSVLRHAALSPEYDRRLQDLVVPVISSWLDQGMAGWTNPYREGGGLWGFFADGIVAAPRWVHGTITDDLRRRVRAHFDAGRTVDEVIVAELQTCAPAGQELEWCREVLFSLKGWSGMVGRLEAEPAVAPIEAPPPSLRDWLAVLLVCTHSLDVTMGLTQAPGPSPSTLDLGRLRRFQEAYERSFAVEFLAHVTAKFAPARAAGGEQAELQVLACMDDRVESMRRALEAEGVETIGTVGFFGLDMRFQGLGKGRPTRQCPPVVEPSRVIKEHAVGADALRMERTRRLGGAGQKASLALFYQSRSLFRGFVVSIALGLFSFLPLLFKLVWPSGVTTLRTRLQRFAFPRARTRIGLDDEGGYTVDEQSRIVEGILRAAGHTRFAPIVVVLGHGSTSTNNPFRQAYGCGACSGNPGAPNARAFAQMANTEAVRARLAYRGLVIPPTTTFVAAFHDTALSEVELLDTELLPKPVQDKLPELELLFREACRLDATERAKRFAQAPAGGPDALVQHMKDRGHDLAQPRPEYGHNRVAACVVGRRELTADTFLDRRCFLVSYDPTQDPDGAQLAAAVLGSVPVAVNIGMDYYFSRVDPDGFGAGSKLPLNVSSLLGVITGSKSDLRIGLARQMVELHEPMRMLVLLEASQAHVEKLVEGHARMKRMVHHGWMRLGRIDPQTRAVTMWTKAGWVPWREHFAEAAAYETRPLPQVFDVTHDCVLEVAA